MLDPDNFLSSAALALLTPDVVEAIRGRRGRRGADAGKPGAAVPMS